MRSFRPELRLFGAPLEYAFVGQLRHFTVTGFVSMRGATLLHWHRKVGLWLPPGGHIEPDEDPIQAVRREALEETGIEVEIVPTAPAFDYADPPQLPLPAAFMEEPIRSFGGEPAHHHLDLIYFTRPAMSERPDAPGASWRWVTREGLADDLPLTHHGEELRVSEDVRILGMAAIDAVAATERDR